MKALGDSVEAGQGAERDLMTEPERAEFMAHFDALLTTLGLARGDLGGAHYLRRTAEHLPSVHKLSLYAGLSMMAAAHAAAAFGCARGQAGQNLSLDLSEAAQGLNPERLFGPTLNGRPYASVGISNNPYLRAPFRTADGRYIMLSALYPAMATKLTAFLGCEQTVSSVAACVAGWQGEALETALMQKGFAATLCRTAEAWRAHPQGAWLESTPVVSIEPTGAAPRRVLAQGQRPLEGIRVLSLGRALAGPIVGRTLAEQGADVLGVCRPGEAEHESVWCEAHIGHRSCALDLKDTADQNVLDALIKNADVIINNYQSHRLRQLGFCAKTLQPRFPGLIYISIDAFGEGGPWQSRSGFDMNASAATGIMATEAGDGAAPQLPNCHLIHDVVAGLFRRCGGGVGFATAVDSRE